jgi:hypothetical protein
MKALNGLLGGNSTKFLTAVLGAGVESLATSHFDWRTLVAGMATAACVYLFPNKAPEVPAPAVLYKQEMPPPRTDV